VEGPAIPVRTPNTLTDSHLDNPDAPATSLNPPGVSLSQARIDVILNKGFPLVEIEGDGFLRLKMYISEESEHSNHI
jgi:hypothetical protein